MPAWLPTLAVVSLVVGFVCAAAIALDIFRNGGQKMWIMDIVWPVTALYSGPLGLLAYIAFGRPMSRAKMAKQKPPEKPFWATVAIAATHCGGGCTLGDIAAGWLMFAAPLVIAGHKIFGEWLVAYAFAYAFGIVFQYFTIAPMRRLGFAEGVWAAVKADTLSLTAWQVGMYGWMAIVRFRLFGEIPKTSPVFWFMMQIAMLAGFVTSYPVNWWLVTAGLKERM